MAKRAKAPAVPNSVQDREALVKAIARAGSLHRKRGFLEADAEECIADIRTALAERVLPIDTELANITKDVQAYCEANKLALLPEGFKSVNVGTGDLGWRADPPSVKHLGTVEQAVMMLKAIQLSQFVRVEESINKDALLAFRRTALAAKDDEVGQITKRSWAALTACGAVKFSTGKEKFWFTPATVEAPVVVAEGDEVAA